MKIGGVTDAAVSSSEPFSSHMRLASRDGSQELTQLLTRPRSSRGERPHAQTAYRHPSTTQVTYNARSEMITPTRARFFSARQPSIRSASLRSRYVRRKFILFHGWMTHLPVSGNASKPLAPTRSLPSAKMIGLIETIVSSAFRKRDFLVRQLGPRA